MLIPFHNLKIFSSKPVRGVLHLGAHECEERAGYLNHFKLTDNEIIWIEANPQKVDEMKKKNWESKMILQVHDELVFDAVESELPALKELILSCMTTAMELPNGVPVEAEIGQGKNWLEAH